MRWSRRIGLLVAEIVALEFLRKGNVGYAQHIIRDMGIVRKLARISAGVN